MHFIGITTPSAQNHSGVGWKAGFKFILFIAEDVNLVQTFLPQQINTDKLLYDTKGNILGNNLESLLCLQLLKQKISQVTGSRKGGVLGYRKIINNTNTPQRPGVGPAAQPLHLCFPRLCLRAVS